MIQHFPQRFLLRSLLPAAIGLAATAFAACGGPVAMALPNGTCTQVGDSADTTAITSDIEMTSNDITLTFDGGAVSFLEFHDADGEELYAVRCHGFMDNCIESPFTLGDTDDRSTDYDLSPDSLRGAGEVTLFAERYDSRQSCDPVAFANTTFTL